MTEIKKRGVVIASESQAERYRLMAALRPVFSDRNETPEFFEIEDYRDLKKVLKELSDGIVTLVVAANFEGQWYQIFKGIEKITEKAIVIMMDKNSKNLEAGKKHGVHPVLTSDGEPEVARIAGALLVNLEE